MTRLRTLIKEILSIPKKKDCGCGCNTCGDKAPILTEGKFKSLISEGLQHHIDKKISLFESVYRIGSDKHLSLIREARALWIRGIIEVSDDDKGLLETHLGHFGLYEGVEVPLDLPMVNEEKKYFGVFKKGGSIGQGKDEPLHSFVDKEEAKQKAKRLRQTLTPGEKSYYRMGYIVRPTNVAPESLNEEFSPTEQKMIKQIISYKKRGSDMINLPSKPREFYFKNKEEIDALIEKEKWPKTLPSRYRDEYRFELEKVTPTYQDKPGRAKYRVIDIESGELKGTPVFETPDSLMAFADDLIKPQGGTQSTNLGESLEERINTILEAKKKKKKEKKDPPLNKPKRGGSKAYYVYVRDPKTKKIKKVSFGSGGLRAKIKNKEARNSFAARHNCKNKKDRTMAGYWSCNLPRYADQLGLGSKMNTFW